MLHCFAYRQNWCYRYARKAQCLDRGLIAGRRRQPVFDNPDEFGAALRAGALIQIALVSTKLGPADRFAEMIHCLSVIARMMIHDFCPLKTPAGQASE